MEPKLGFDVTELSENAQDDLEGLEASAAHVASLLSTEPTDSKLSLPAFFHMVFPLGPFVLSDIAIGIQLE